MIKDTCITVDTGDAILGHASKRDVHMCEGRLVSTGVQAMPCWRMAQHA